MNQILQWVRSIVIYMILVTTLWYLLPDNQYKKYIRLFTGLLLILIVLKPAADFLTEADLVDVLYDAAVVWQEDSESEQVLGQLEESDNSFLLEYCEEQVCRQISEELIQEGYTEAEVGVELSVDGIQKISAELTAVDSMSSDEKKEEKERLTEKLSETYQLSERNIEVSIQ